MGRVTGKVIIVTGAGAGLGAAIADRLVGEGAIVVRTDIVDGPDIVLQDAADEAGWRMLVDETLAAHGRLDGVVNNAGIVASKGPSDPEAALLDDWRRINRVNLESVFLGCKYTIPAMAKSGGGSIVNMSSIAALTPTPFIAAYGASKAAVTQFTRSVALHCCEKGHAIRCNSVHPGQVRTPMHDQLVADVAAEHGIGEADAAQAFLTKVPMRQWQQAVDIANAALFLLSDEARFVTGTAIVVDGGMSLTN